jgi:two-component system, LuxR family, response regulator FixJ
MVKLTGNNSPSRQSSPGAICILEDEDAPRRSLRFLLESVGFEVIECASAAEFMQSFDPDTAACLITDVRLQPDGPNGLDIQDRLRQMESSVPVIVVSAYGDVPMAVRAMKGGAVHFLKKPFGSSELLEQVDVAIEHHQKLREARRIRLEVTARFERLTSREAEVLEEVVNGKSSREIGEMFEVSFKTVEAHRAKIMRKVGAESIPELMKLYFVWTGNASPLFLREPALIDPQSN